MKIAVDTSLSRFGTEPIPVAHYCSSEYFENEKTHVFRRTWLYAGMECDVASPGDYLVKEFDFLDASIVIVRGKDNKLRAFHNVCAHRLSRLVWQEKGNARHFVCPYHSWGYNLNGDLASIPDAENFYDLDAKNCGLSPVAVDSANGLLFIHLGPEPEQSLEAFLGPVYERLHNFPLQQWTSHVEFTADLPVNWKCIVDNFQETYHVFSAHAVSVNERSVGTDNPMGYPLKFEFFNQHRGMDIWANPDYVPKPVERIVMNGGGIVGQTKIESQDDNDAVMFVFGLFPNVVLNITPYFLQLHESLPLAVDETRWRTTAFFPPAKSVGQRLAQEYSAVLLRDISAEDVGILSSLQKGMKSGAHKHLQFQATEVLCRHLVINIEQAINKGIQRHREADHGA
jgi:phenylpropionate dioxygenase-like ring-hydroxylating dioxygenase large terminal subunit